MDQRQKEGEMPVSRAAVTTSRQTEKDDLEAFCQRHFKASGPRLVAVGKIKHLKSEGKLNIGPTTGQQSDGGRIVTIIYALTKATGCSPNGEILIAYPRSRRG